MEDEDFEKIDPSDYADVINNDCLKEFQTIENMENQKMARTLFSPLKKYAYNNLGDFIQLILDHPKISPGNLIAPRRFITINPSLFDTEMILKIKEIKNILKKSGKENIYIKIYDPIQKLLKNGNKPVLHKFSDLCKLTYAESNELIDRSEIEVIRDDMQRLNGKMQDSALAVRLAALKTGGNRSRGTKSKRSRSKRSKSKRTTKRKQSMRKTVKKY